MLEELKNLNYHGGKDGLLFFLCDVIGRTGVSIRDAEVICSHAPGKRQLSVEDLVSYCLALGWIKKEADVLTIIADFEPVLDNKDVFNEELTKSTVEQLFLGGAIDQTMFSYDSIQSSYAFKNELLPLSFSCARNVLISQGFLIPQRGPQGTRFYIAPLYVPYKIGKLQIQGFSEPTTPNKIKQSYHITQKAARSRPRAAFLRGKLGRRQDFSKK